MSTPEDTSADPSVDVVPAVESAPSDSSVPGAQGVAEVVPNEASRPAERDESVEQPAKVLRIGSMVKQLLEEVRSASLDEAGRERLRDIYETSVRELAAGLSPDLREELALFSLPFDEEAPSQAELRIAQAQLVGWLEGLFHGIQATLFAQQVAAQAQFQEVRGRGLPPGAGPGGPQGGDAPRSGTYL